MLLKNGKIDYNLKVVFLLLSVTILVWMFLQLAIILFPILGRIIHKCLPIIVGITVAFILNPLVDYISNKFFNGNKKLTSILVIIFMIGFLIFIIYPIFITFINNFYTLNIYSEKILNKFINMAFLSDNVKETIIGEFNKFSSLFLQNLLGIINNFLSVCAQVVISLITIIFTLLEYDLIKEKILSYVKTSNSGLIVKYINGLEREILYYLKSMLLGFLIVWLVFVFGLLILNINYVLSFSFILALLIILIPIIGPLISTLILAIILLYNPTFINIIGFLFLSIFIQIFVNIISPRIFAHTLNLYNLIVIICFFVGNAFFGLLGALFSLPFVIIIKYTLNFVNNVKRDKQYIN